MLNSGDPVDISVWKSDGTILELKNCISLRYNFYGGVISFNDNMLQNILTSSKLIRNFATLIQQLAKTYELTRSVLLLLVEENVGNFLKDARRQAVLTHSVGCYSYIFIFWFPTTIF